MHIEQGPVLDHAEQENLRRLLHTLEDGGLDGASRLVATARRVLVIGMRNSYPMELHLREQLVQAREQVSLGPVPGLSLGEDLAELGPRDVVVLFGFRRRATGFAHLVAAIHRREIPLLVIADSSARRHSETAAYWLDCPIDSVSAGPWPGRARP